MQLRAIALNSKTLNTIANSGVVTPSDIANIAVDILHEGEDRCYFIPNVVDETDRPGCWQLVEKDTFEAVYNYPATKINTEFVEIHPIV